MVDILTVTAPKRTEKELTTAARSKSRDKKTVLILVDHGAYVVLDAAPQIKESFKSKVTSHIVDSGANVSTNINPENVNISIDGVVSDGGFVSFSERLNAFKSKFSGVANSLSRGMFGSEQQPAETRSVKEAIKLIQAIAGQKDANGAVKSPPTAVTVIFSNRTYNNCYFTSLDIERDKDTYRTTKFSATLEQVRKVTLSRATIDSTKTNKEVADSIAKKENSGKVATDKVAVTSPKEDASYLFGIQESGRDWISGLIP